MQFLADFGDYEPWSGATSTAERIKDAGKWDELETHLEEMFSDKTPTAGQINDYLWHDSDEVYKSLDMKPDYPDTKTAEELGQEWCDDYGYRFIGATIENERLVIQYRDLDDDHNPTNGVQTETMDADEVAAYMYETHVEFDEVLGNIEYW